ncbi:DUF2535 family protein [Peribacillus acanthi]|uniref:DUF2535 family protein n=1 Tax=Peribacillus acanthi TaxID=2171554 RepID=UPI000D3EA0FC|nr:DUF2535 family protein [Peribacillus acanthi]
MLFKSLEFKNEVGQKVKVIDIPVLEEDSTFRFMITSRLELFIRSVYLDKGKARVHSFKEYLRRTMKWPHYEKLFQETELKNNA